ncbi:unnamed protein product [Arabis nemorensis]|uniref:NYN domain-containing protein n=1 Tax=Arabis nemorensis TaxID=586526 RepID=A0A565BFG4_9BRAS|nr:unnamed protein product [Arabis nemorensis]
MFCDMSAYLNPDSVVEGDPNKVVIVRRKTDVADKYAMLGMYMEACRTPNILVISSDGDFINAIDRMITRGGISVMVAVHARFDLNSQFLHVPVATWIWSSENPNEETMIHNGHGLVREGYQLPQGRLNE